MLSVGSLKAFCRKAYIFQPPSMLGRGRQDCSAFRGRGRSRTSGSRCEHHGHASSTGVYHNHPSTLHMPPKAETPPAFRFFSLKGGSTRLASSVRPHRDLQCTSVLGFSILRLVSRARTRLKGCFPVPVDGHQCRKVHNAQGLPDVNTPLLIFTAVYSATDVSRTQSW